MLVAKMKAGSVSVVDYGSAEKPEPQEQVNLSAVYSEDPENVNRAWSKATPSGSLMLTISNPGAHGQIVENREYIITIRPAEPGE